jgi:hypothetical protein
MREFLKCSSRWVICGFWQIDTVRFRMNPIVWCYDSIQVQFCKIICVHERMWLMKWSNARWKGYEILCSLTRPLSLPWSVKAFFRKEAASSLRLAFQAQYVYAQPTDKQIILREGLWRHAARERRRCVVWLIRAAQAWLCQWRDKMKEWKIISSRRKRT